MNLTQPLRLKGAPGSPYTRKMLAYMRYRHIGYELLIGDQATEGLELPKPKVELLPTFYLPGDSGEIEAVVDSTPLIRRFEDEFGGRETLPENPVLAFLNYLIEDYADEWLTKSMFHYRWYFDADIKKAGSILPLWRGLQMSTQQHEAAAAFVADRQISRLYVVGSNDVTAPIIEASYRRFLKILDAIIARQTFLLGSRPSSADFGVYAQLTQLAKFDPTPMSICLQEAPRVYAWTDVIDDLSGQDCHEDGWMRISDVREVLGPLLEEIGRVYAPALIANAKALQSGDKQMEATIDGKRWEQPSFPYQGRCLAWIREEYHKLSADNRAQVDDIIEGTGCEVLLQ